MKILTTLFTILAMNLSVMATAAEADRFVGTWLFDAIEVLDDNGNWVPANDPRVGMNPIGFISYDSNGNMSVQLMRRDRTNLSTTRIDAVDSELSEAFRGYVAYFGTYEVLENEGIVLHHQSGNLDPNQTGSAARRAYSFVGSTLTLMPSENRRLRWRKP